MWAIRWYGSTPLSYAHLSAMLEELGISVNARLSIAGLLSTRRNYAGSSDAISLSTKTPLGS